MINLKLKVIGDYKYEARSFAGYGYVTKHIHKFVTDDGKIYIWNTHGILTYKHRDPNGEEVDARGKRWSYTHVTPGSVVEISAKIKGESEYKGEHQTELEYVRISEVISYGKTDEEIAKEKEATKAAKKEAQYASITANDQIWTMPYRQYKQHYSDCETIIDSYEDRGGHKVISVIIRDGRMKPSGVRGQKFSGYEITFKINGEDSRCTFWAVSQKNAFKQLAKFFPDAEDPELYAVY